eukprot:TRINITY_DN21506_c0_g1_i1.p1 TRINITY_DN21506_c0_g1~~TRINITY_DN21506_c0_g1_i1.p1  ORF type:complete len:295 (+),score=39.27 TRINITY_DN21506_c0_g1_i1:115-999(+)
MPRIGDVVELCRLEGEGWEGFNRKIGVIEEVTANNTIKVVVSAVMDVTVPKANIIPIGLNVSIGQLVFVQGLQSPDWQHLNGLAAKISRGIDEQGRVTCSFVDNQIGEVPILLRNLRQGPVSAGMTMMLKQGTLVEIFGLKDPSFVNMNGCLGVVSSGKVRFEGGSTGRVPVVVGGESASFLPSNIRPARNAKYLDIHVDPNDVTQGIEFSSNSIPLVHSVRKNSSSWFAGIRPGDILFAVASEVTSCPFDVWNVFTSLSDGSKCCVVTVAGSQQPSSYNSDRLLKNMSSPYFV